MTHPEQPKDHPEAEPASTTPTHAPNGVPPGATDTEPKGRPTSDRQATEAAASPDQHKPS